MFCLKTGANSSVTDNCSEISKAPFINSNRSSISKSVFESNYVSEPFCPSFMQSNEEEYGPESHQGEDVYFENFPRLSRHSAARKASRSMARPCSVSEWPNCSLPPKPTKYFSVVQDQFEKLENAQIVEKPEEDFRPSLDLGGAYHCVNCSRRLFDADVRINCLGGETIRFSKSENGGTVTVPEKRNGSFRDVVKCIRCKKAVGLRGGIINDMCREKLFEIDSNAVKFRLKIVM